MSCAHPCALLRSPAFFSSISCAQNPICPKDVIERTVFLDNSRYLHQVWSPHQNGSHLMTPVSWVNSHDDAISKAHSVSWDAKSPSPMDVDVGWHQTGKPLFVWFCLQIQVKCETKTDHKHNLIEAEWIKPLYVDKKNECIKFNQQRFARFYSSTTNDKPYPDSYESRHLLEKLKVRLGVKHNSFSQPRFVCLKLVSLRKHTSGSWAMGIISWRLTPSPPFPHFPKSVCSLLEKNIYIAPFLKRVKLR